MIIVIGGVTASGKTDIAFKLAKVTGGIVVNADAFAIYKEMNVGTAKPSEKELKEYETHLFNIVSVADNYSIFDYQRDARKVIEHYKNFNVPVIFVGGSGLYLRAALYDYRLIEQDIPPYEDDPSVTNEELYQKLSDLDFEASQKIHPNNRKRLLRALAVVSNSGMKKSVNEKVTTKKPLYPYLMVTINPEKEDINARILERTREMMSKGLRDEVMDLTVKFLPTAQGLQAIGYKEIYENPDADDEFLINLISTKTRQLAKRQRTFFRHQFNSSWFNNNEEAYTFLLEQCGGNNHD